MPTIASSTTTARMVSTTPRGIPVGPDAVLADADADGDAPTGASSGLADTGGTSAVSAGNARMVPKPKIGSRPGLPLSLAVTINRLITFAALS